SATPLGSNRNRPSVSVQGAGVADAAKAAQVAVRAGHAGRVDFGTVAPGASARVQLELRDADGRPVEDVGRVLLDDGGRATPSLTLDQDALVIDVADDAADGHVGGWIVLDAHGIRIPWSATVRDAAAATTP